MDQGEKKIIMKSAVFNNYNWSQILKIWCIPYLVVLKMFFFFLNRGHDPLVVNFSFQMPSQSHDKLSTPY